MNNRQIAHAWAHQQKTNGKGSNFFFERDIIYSYGYHFPIAKVIAEKKLVFFTTKSYSVSTSKHMAYTRQAIPHDYNIIYLSDIPTREGLNFSISKELLEFDKEYDAQIVKVARARTRNPMRKCVSMVYNIKKCFELFPDEISDENKLALTTRQAMFENIEEISKQVLKKANELDRKKVIKDREKAISWMSMEIHSLNSTYQYIRQNNGLIETSLGLTFEKEECKQFFGAIKSGLISKGFKFKNYTVIKNDKKEFIIGCHKFLKCDFPLFEGVLK